MTGAPIAIPLATIEGHHLARLVDDFVALLEAPDAQDPAVARLTPAVYPDDAVAAEEFAAMTRDDLLERRIADARAVRDALSPFSEVAEELTESEALAEQVIVISTTEVEPWLRTLTAIRLVIATRLGITSDDPAPDSPGHDVFDWLGYRLELLVQAAEEADLSI